MSRSWYERHVLPHALDYACGLPMVGRQRQLVVDVEGMSLPSNRAMYIGMGVVGEIKASRLRAGSSDRTRSRATSPWPTAWG